MHQVATTRLQTRYHAHPIEEPTNSAPLIWRQPIEEPNIRMIIDAFEMLLGAVDISRWIERDNMMFGGVLY